MWNTFDRDKSTVIYNIGHQFWHVEYLFYDTRYDEAAD